MPGERGSKLGLFEIELFDTKEWRERINGFGKIKNLKPPFPFSSAVSYPPPFFFPFII